MLILMSSKQLFVYHFYGVICIAQADKLFVIAHLWSYLYIGCYMGGVGAGERMIRIGRGAIKTTARDKLLSQSFNGDPEQYCTIQIHAVASTETTAGSASSGRTPGIQSTTGLYGSGNK